MQVGTTVAKPTLMQTKAVQKFGTAFLSFTLISVFAMLILPISSGLLDALLMLNIVGTIALLIFCVTAQDSLKLYSFPTLLLISTLYRLGLNLSSTRLILSEGEAGQIIETFGRTLTSGNLTVGLISFLVLQVIQFLVISKGAERVSEVSARFTLDALPGKQMSIDADMRAGLLTNETAQERRKDLIQESKFYGSMDGAMKFVKGETIASFLIVAINLFGGFAIGILQKGMSFEKAIQIYSMLTIGDGLAAQIPSLLLSLSAGILVTRVASSKENTTLGSELEEQFFSEPKKLYLVAFGIMPLAFIPGFPALLFLSCSACVGLLATALKYKQSQQEQDLHSIETYKVDLVTDQATLGQVHPLLLELSSDLYQQFLQDARWQTCLNSLFPKLKNLLSSKLGVPFPTLKIAVNETLAPAHYVIQIYEVTADEGVLSAEHCVIRNYSNANPVVFEADEREDKTAHGTPIALLRLAKEQSLLQQGFKVIPPEEMLLKHLGIVLKRFAHDFIGIQEVKNILNQVEQTHSELVKEVVPRIISINRLTDVIKRLVEENVPIKDFRLILEVLANCNADNKDALALTEILRNGLKRIICQQHWDNDKTLRLITLASYWEQEITASIQQTQGESYLHLEPEKIALLQQAVLAHLRNNQLSPKDIVIVTQPEARRFLKKILHPEIPDLAVLSYAELMGHLKTHNYGEVNESQSHDQGPGELRLVEAQCF